MNPVDLHEAAFDGDLTAVLAALAAGCPVDSVGEDGWTALAWAAYRGHLGLIEALLTAGADVNYCESEEGESILIFATQQDDEAIAVQVVTRLLAAGAAVNAPDHLGWTALTHVAVEGRVDLARCLLAAGADPDLHRDTGSSARELCYHPAVVALFPPIV